LLSVLPISKQSKVAK